MSAMRDRAKNHFPMVLLTLLSIVQALALELLWSHVRDADYLFQWSLANATSWIQIAATLLALVLIWVVYASTAMRFRWVPVTSDSVYPFLIGLFEFVLIESLDQGEVGRWLVVMAVIFGMMVRVSHRTMRRARLDGDNDAFFSQFEPANWRDFVPEFATGLAVALAGTYLWWGDRGGSVALTAVVAVTALLLWQFYNAARFWRITVTEAE